MSSSRTRADRDSPVSLRHVAQAAGVSAATVSRVVSGSDHPVSEATRERVLEAVERLAFEPNRLARALVTARSQTIGVVVHDIADPYFADIVRGLEDGLHAEDYTLLVASSDRDPGREVGHVKVLHAQQVDAVVFAASSLAEPGYEREIRAVVDRYRAAGGAVVTLSEHVLPCPRVVFDNDAAIGEMVEYLVGKGHRRIGYLAGPDSLSVTHARLKAYEVAIVRAGIAFDPGLVEHGPFTIEGGAEACGRLLARADVTALLCANDLTAIGAVHAAARAGIAVPGQLSVAGLDDIQIAPYGLVPLTTYAVPTYEMGRRGAGLVLTILAGDEPADVTVQGHVVERESVGPPGTGRG